DGTATWEDPASGGGNSNWTISGDTLYNNNAGNTGIGTDAPLAKLHIADSGTVVRVDGGGGTDTLLDQQIASGASSSGFSNSILNTEWQSFTPGVSGMLFKVAPVLRTNASAFTQAVTMSVYSGEGTGGTLLYTMTQNVSVSTSLIPYDFVISGSI